MTQRRILFAGDTHGNFGHMQFLLNVAAKEDADAVFVLGDFGIWDHDDQGSFTDAVSKYSVRAGKPVYFLPGNHENYDLLEQWEKENDRDEDGFVIVKPNVLYSPRGHRWSWGGVRFMSLGGAYSVDLDARKKEDAATLEGARRKVGVGHRVNARQRYLLKFGHYLWWPQEEITEDDLVHALRPGAVDVLLTHDKPRDSDPGWNRKDLFRCHPNQDKIQKVVHAKRPQVLLHGHLHHPYEQMVGQTWVRSLNCDPEASLKSGGSGDRHSSYTVMSFENGSADFA